MNARKNNLRKIKTTKGFTLIELIIYLAIVSVIVNTLVLFAWNVIGQGSKGNRQQEVYSAAMFLSEKIKYEIRNADDINTASSDFGINLAANAGKKISLKATGANDPIIFDVLSDQARIKRGVNASVPLNPTGTKITDLTFINFSSGTGTTKSIQFTLTVTALNPSAGNVYETTSIESSAEVRSH